MVKLTRKFPFILREQAKAILALKGKGLFSREPFSPSKNIEDYYDKYENDSVVFGAINSKAYAAVGRGFDIELDEDYPHADEVKQLIEDFCEAHDLDALVPNITVNMLIAGFCPVETFITSLPEKCVLRIVHPKTVDKLEWDKDHTKPIRLIQKVGMKTARLNFNSLAWFCHRKIGNDPFGVSDIASVLTYLEYKSKSVEKMDAIMDRYASPKGIWKSRGDIKPLRDLVLTSKAGEDIFLGNLPDDELDKIVEFLDIDPRARFWEYIQYIDQLIYVGLIAPNLFYFKDATEASARVLLEIVDRDIHAIARTVKREIEKKWFKPLVTLNGYTELPKIKWRQKPPMKELHLPELIAQGIQAGFISREEFIELLNNLGVSFEVEVPPQPQPLPPPFPITQALHEGNETYIVTRLGKKQDVNPDKSHTSHGSNEADSKRRSR